MSERRTLLSRPRTRVYDCNYNIGEKYYKPMVEQLDRKYSGGLSPASTFKPSSARLREEEDSFKPRRSFAAARDDFESLPERRSRLNGAKSLEDDLEDDIINSMNRLKVLRAARGASVDEDFSSYNGTSKRRFNFSNKILDSVGINGKSQDALEEEILKKRTVKLPSLFDEENSSFAKWTAVRESSVDDSSAELSAKARARQSRARLADIESEIDAVNERGAARDKRISNIRALIAGEPSYTDSVDSFTSKKVSSKSVKNVSY